MKYTTKENMEYKVEESERHMRRMIICRHLVVNRKKKGEKINIVRRGENNNKTSETLTINNKTVATGWAEIHKYLK